jgi:hypothetical protein
MKRFPHHAALEELIRDNKSWGQLVHHLAWTAVNKPTILGDSVHELLQFAATQASINADELDAAFDEVCKAYKDDGDDEVAEAA